MAPANLFQHDTLAHTLALLSHGHATFAMLFLPIIYHNKIFYRSKQPISYISRHGLCSVRVHVRYNAHRAGSVVDTHGDAG